jgi:8-oxo-dGTP pyrophosphatase MutT (NUDIX family)
MDELENTLEGKLLHSTEKIGDFIAEGLAAAVLILLVKIKSEWNIVYTRRTNGVRTHQGEVSFPGGAYEKGDLSMDQTALRETWEEIGVKPDCIKLLGGLNPIKTISNFMVYPYVGIMNCSPVFKINVDEVETVFLIPVNWLKDEANKYEQDHIIDEHTVRRVIHYVDYHGEHLWGLTARITQEILTIM